MWHIIAIVVGEVCKMGRRLRDLKLQMLRWMDFRYSPASWNKKSKYSWQKNDMIEEEYEKSMIPWGK